MKIRQWFCDHEYSYTYSEKGKPYQSWFKEYDTIYYFKCKKCGHYYSISDQYLEDCVFSRRTTHAGMNESEEDARRFFMRHYVSKGIDFKGCPLVDKI